MRKLIVTALLLSVPTMALAQVTRGEMRGEYVLKYSEYLDPPTDVPPDRVVIEIEGEAARNIYLAMPQEPQEKLCDELTNELGSPPGKVAGPWVCAGDEEAGYSCLMAIMLETGEGVNAVACD